MPIAVNSTMVQSIVVAIIVFLVQLLFLEFLVLANAQMQREMQAHADFGGVTSLTLRTEETLKAPGDISRIGVKAGACVVESGVALIDATPYFTEDGSKVTTSAAAAVGAVVATSPVCKWVKAPVIVEQFSGIILIIGEIIPLLLVVAIAAEAFALVYLRSASGGITSVVGSRVALLVVAYVVILFGSTVFDFAESALGVFLNDVVTGTERFDDISKLLLSLIPLAYELLVLGILGWNTYSGSRAVSQRYNARRGGVAAAAGGGPF